MKNRASGGLLTIRHLDPASAAEIALVAERMRQTLIEVEGPEVGGGMYAMDWLVDRVRFHLDAARSTGAVFVADLEGALVGHTIVRVERDESGARFGLFSTTYVAPAHRCAGVAGRLVVTGEAWMKGHGLSSAATWTSAANDKLIGLYRKHGYGQGGEAIHQGTGTRMVRLARALVGP